MNYDFQHCIRCTICVENCPVFKVNPAFPGPKQAGPDSERFRVDEDFTRDEWIRLCSQCKRCEVACPYGVNPAEIILREQLTYGARHFRSLPYRMFAHINFLGSLSSLAAPVVNGLSSIRFLRRLMGILGISTDIPFPRFQFRSLRTSWRWKGKRKSRRRVVFFHGCFLNYNRPDIGRGIRNLLASMGLRVVIPSQVCCGLPALGNGDREGALKYARKNARMLVKYIDRGYDIIYSCTSCGLSLTQDYPGILELPEGKKIAENTYNVHEYIIKLMEEDDMELVFRPLHKKIAYFIPCHLRALDIGHPAARLFEQIPGLQCRIIDDHCCGLSGSYGYKSKNSATARRLGEISAAAIREGSPDMLVADCGACRTQLEHAASLPAFDPAEIIMDCLKSARISSHSDWNS